MPYDRSQFVTRSAQEDICFDFQLEAEDFIADKVFTPKPVDAADTKVFQADTSKLKIYETRRKTNTEADLIDEQLFGRNITLEEHKLGSEINPRDVRDASVPSMLAESRKLKLVTNALLMKREDLAVTLATTTGNYPAALTSAIASGSRWDEAGGDPESDKVTADSALLNSCGRIANALAMDFISCRRLSLSPNFRDRVKYTGSGPVTLEHIKAFFGVDHLFLGKARRDSAVEGAAASIAGMWGTNALFFVHNPGAALEDISYGHQYVLKTPFWTDVLEDQKRKGPAGAMKRVQVGMEYKLDRGFVVSSSDDDFAAGYLFRTVTA